VGADAEKVLSELRALLSGQRGVDADVVRAVVRDLRVSATRGPGEGLTAGECERMASTLETSLPE
jgi:hypothetical protein